VRKRRGRKPDAASGSACNSGSRKGQAASDRTAARDFGRATRAGERLVVLAALVVVLLLQLHTLDDGDTWWHLADGRLIARTGAVPRADPFSYTAPGAPWVNRQWLFDLGAFAAWRLGGAAALVLGSGVLFAGAFVALWALVRRRLGASAAAVLVVVAAQAAVERFAVRPEALTFCLLAVYVLVLDDRRLPPACLAGLVALQVLWANAHALSVLGLVVVATELGSAAAARWLPLPAGWRAASAREDLGPLGLATAGCALAEAATPFGVGGALFPLRLVRVITGGEVTSAPVIEHRATALGALAPPAAAALVVLVALAVVAVASVRRVRLSYLVRAVAFAALALAARRNVALVGPGVLPLVADGLAPAAAAVGLRLAARPRLALAALAALVAALGSGSAWIATGWYYQAARLTRTVGLGQSALLFPPGAVDFLDAQAPEARVFNDDVLGGYLLWRSRSARRVFIDGRFQVYPASLYAEYERTLEDPSTFAALAARWGVGAAVLYHPAPGRLELARAIARLPGWRLAYVDAGAVVLLADGERGGVAVGATGDERSGGAARRAARLGPPFEEAVSHYQRGRALLYLLGRDGVAAARRDFEAALRLWPGFEDARVGLARTAG
jgi:hypothetical protein